MTDYLHIYDGNGIVIKQLQFEHLIFQIKLYGVNNPCTYITIRGTVYVIILWKQYNIYTWYKETTAAPSETKFRAYFLKRKMFISACSKDFEKN